KSTGGTVTGKPASAKPSGPAKQATTPTGGGGDGIPAVKGNAATAGKTPKSVGGTVTGKPAESVKKPTGTVTGGTPGKKVTGKKK
ncbi:MAG: hypothetical protein Q9217_006393, partial [Psora testacea]